MRWPKRDDGLSGVENIYPDERQGGHLARTRSGSRSLILPGGGEQLIDTAILDEETRMTVFVQVFSSQGLFPANAGGMGITATPTGVLRWGVGEALFRKEIQIGPHARPIPVCARNVILDVFNPALGLLGGAQPNLLIAAGTAVNAADCDTRQDGGIWQADAGAAPGASVQLAPPSPDGGFMAAAVGEISGSIIVTPVTPIWVQLFDSNLVSAALPPAGAIPIKGGISPPLSAGSGFGFSGELDPALFGFAGVLAALSSTPNIFTAVAATMVIAGKMVR